MKIFRSVTCVVMICGSPAAGLDVPIHVSRSHSGSGNIWVVQSAAWRHFGVYIVMVCVSPAAQSERTYSIPPRRNYHHSAVTRSI